MAAVNIKAPAKINLFLEVTGKRPDGFHDIATLFAKIGLSDELILKKTPKPGITLFVKDKVGLPPLKTEDNIIYKAAVRFFEAFGIDPAVAITLVKRVPVGAGLGGGSSDGAAALRGLCRLYGVDVDRNIKRLSAIALKLGSDVPFFLRDWAFASGCGRGEILKKVCAKGRLPKIVLVYPDVPVYTGPVYKALKPVVRSEISANLKKFRAFTRALGRGLTAAGMKMYLFNRLEAPVMPVYSKVRKAKADLMASGSAALMSGSGASVFALVEDKRSALKLAASLKKKWRKVFVTDFLLK